MRLLTCNVDSMVVHVIEPFIFTDIMPKSGLSDDVNVVTVTLATLVAVLLISNALFFITGCICGHYLCQKCKKLAKRDSQATPAYPDRQMKITIADEQEVELEQNVAYGHVWGENISGN